MNIRYKNSILFFFVGLLSVPQALLATPVGFQVLPFETPKSVRSKGKKDEDKGEDATDGPMSASRFNPDQTSVFLTPSRDFIRPLVRAIRIHKEGDHVHAAELIGQFLVDMGEEDFLIFKDKVDGTAVSVSSIANEMLESLPDSAMKAYRVRFGIPAKQRLNLAVAESNYFEIAQVKQRFLHTDAGLEAAMLLGHHHFDAGRVLLAADSFQTALDLAKRQKKSDEKLSVLTAVSWVLARRSELAENVMRDLAKSNRGKLRIGDQDVTIDDAQPLSAINSFVDAGPLVSSAAVDQWLLVGGNARRNVTTAGGFPVGQPLWEVDVDAKREDLQKVRRNRETISSDVVHARTSSLVPANVPLIVDGLVLVGDKNKIQAVDFNSGKRVWSVKTGVGFSESAGKQVGIQVPNFQAPITRVDVSSNSIDHSPWNDFLQGHASSDGKFIFRVVKGPGESTNQQPGAVAFGVVSSSNATQNTLQAIDVLNEGGLVWEAGGGRTTGDPRLAEINFLGAPLPVDGVLYAIGRRLEEVILVAMDSADGKLMWMQSLASGENLPRQRYPRPSVSKTNHSLRPSYSDGILVCPTGKNALVAIDTVGRRVLWGMQTTIGTVPKSTSFSPLGRLQNPQVFIENSRIVALDVSTDTRLLAMDLLDGSPLMKIGKAGLKCEDVLHVASVDDDQVVLVEKKRVRAMSSGSGRKLWEVSIADYGPPTGRGYVAEINEDGKIKHALYLPTEANVIIKLDLENNGQIVDGIHADRSFGNLIVHQGRVISRRETSVACFELDSKVVAELKTAVEKAGGSEQLSPALRIKQASLLRNQGKPREAIELLKTMDGSGHSDRFKVEFLHNATLMFDLDPEFALKLFKEHERWFQYETNPELFLGYVELLVENNLVDDMLKQIFEDDSFFTPVASAEKALMLQRPIAGYNFPGSDQAKVKVKPSGGEGAPVSVDASQSKQDDDPAGDGDDDKNASNEKASSLFLESQKKFSQSKISFDPNHWAKTQLIRTVREFPESKAKVQAAIEKQLRAADIVDVVQRHRLFRMFPLELISPTFRFELAEELIAKEHVAEAENMLASLLGGLPAEAAEIKAIEDGPSEEALVALWQQVRGAQYGAKVDVPAASDKAQTPDALDFDRVAVNAVRVPSEYQRDYPTSIEARGELASQLLGDKRLVIWGDGQEIEFLDANGESLRRFALFEDAPKNRINLKGGMGWIKANHSLAVLRIKNLMMAIDLSKLELGQSSVLWYKDVSSLRSSRSEVADEMDVVVSRKLPVEDVVVSFPTTGCCCCFEQDKLVCVDAFTGKTLWRRNKDIQHVRVLGNKNQVVTMDSKQSNCTVFDVRTGERLRTDVISDFTELMWSVEGMRVLASSVSKAASVLEGLEDWVDYRPAEVAVDDGKDGSKKDKQKVRVLSRYDVESNEFVWKKVFSAEAKVCRMARGRMLVLSGDNQVYVFDAKSGEQLTKMPSGLTEDQQEKIKFIGAMEHLGQDLVALVRTRSSSVSSQAYRVRASRSLNTFFSGHLLLLSRGDIKPVWSRPAEVVGFQLLPMLPAASPLLLFNRSIQSARVANDPNLADPPVISSGSFQLLGLDMRTGKVLVNKIFGSVHSVRFYSPIIDPIESTIAMKFSGWKIKLGMKKSMDEPPSPIASVTKDNPVPRNHNVERNVVQDAGDKFDIEEANERLMRQAEEYEAGLEEKRTKERELLKAEAGQSQ